MVVVIKHEIFKLCFFPKVRQCYVCTAHLRMKCKVGWCALLCPLRVNFLMSLKESTRGSHEEEFLGERVEGSHSFSSEVRTLGRTLGEVRGSPAGLQRKV